MSVRVLQIVPDFVPPRAFRRQRCRRLQFLGRGRVASQGVAGGDGLDSEEFGDAGTGHQAAEGADRLFRDHVREAAVPYSAKLLGVHARALGNRVDLSHRFGTEFLGAAVDKGAFVGVLSGLAVVVDELELGLAGLVFAEDVPVLPEFCSVV